MIYDFDSSGTCASTNSLGPSIAEICNATTAFVFLSVFNELIGANNEISGRCNRVIPVDETDEKYDFVVIGGGGAGSVVAGRLSENPDWKVLLLEAGGDEPIAAEVPGLAAALRSTTIGWGFEATNESRACLSSNGICEISAAKMLGGGTSHNGMVYLRGNPTDYNRWADQGNEEWGWENVKEYFLKSEGNGEIERVGTSYHATGGPLSVERFPYGAEISHPILQAADEIGYGLTEDLNGEKFTGFTIVQSTNKNAVRSSSARAFLWPARDRENLHISLNSTATRVIVEDDAVVGVEYYKNNELKTVRVSREAIVSAGAIMSPHILLHSGIGPKEHLESVDVKMVKDMPGVGQNLHTHIGATVQLSINDQDTYEVDYTTVTEYLVNRTGLLASIGPVQVEGIINSSKSNPDYPDIQIYFRGYSSICETGELVPLSSSGKRIISLRAVHLHPKSRGRISLTSNDPLDYPNIWMNYFDESSDIEVLVEGLELGLALIDAEALKSYNITLATTAGIEECSDYIYPSSEYWACAAKHGTVTEAHFVGTCKMGPASDPLAVVDPRLRVHGIQGLRVADASIMPQVPSGNTAAPSIMIGERAADFIKDDWNVNSTK